MTCHKIKEKPTRINFKKVSIKIPTFTITKGGFFSADVALFSVETDAPGEERSKVPRKDVDFYTLRKLIK